MTMPGPPAPAAGTRTSDSESRRTYPSARVQNSVARPASCTCQTIVPMRTMPPSIRLAVAPFNGDHGSVRPGVAGGRDRLRDLDAHPANGKRGQHVPRHPRHGGLDQLELALSDDSGHQGGNSGVIHGVGDVVARGYERDVDGHVDGERERLLDLALPVMHADDRGNPQVPDGDSVACSAASHATNGSAPVSLTIGRPAT